MVRFIRMFDLTSEISLDAKKYSLYQKMRLGLYFAALIFVAYFSFLVLFPHKIFEFSFLEPNSNDNNIATPQINGAMPNMTFSTVLPDYYSQATIILDIGAASSTDRPQITADMRKSYQAFFYDEAEPIGFKDGTLIKNSENHYIVSNGQLRKFSGVSAAVQMGYPLGSFWDVSKDELKYNPSGSDITAGNSYPDDTLFSISEKYYILRNQKLAQFSSQNAFNSQYGSNQAILKEAGFLNQFPASEELAGFSDGSLASNGDSAYIISTGKIYPVDNAQTFIDKGYQWENILPATSAEVSLYERTRLFNIKDPHPDGTIFRTDEDNKYYLIRDGKKHALASEKIAASWKNAPVAASQKSLETIESCQLEKASFWRNKYACVIPLDIFSDFSGNEYQISLKSDDQAEAKSVSVNYKRNTNSSNLKIALLGIFNKIKLNYGIQIPNE